jgi:elongation factor G
MAFRQAGRIAMSEGMPQCSPVLLEPVMAVEIAVPSDATAKVNSIVSSRRGQILGFDARPGWPGWDLVEVHLPESEIQNLIVELRSATAGLAPSCQVRSSGGAHGQGCRTCSRPPLEGGVGFRP